MSLVNFSPRGVAIACSMSLILVSGNVGAFKPEYESHGHTMIARAILDSGYSFGERNGVPWTVTPFRYTLSDGVPRNVSQAAIDQIVSGVKSRDWLAYWSTRYTPIVDALCENVGPFALPGRDAENHIRADASDGGCLLMRVSGDLTDEDGHFDNDNFAGSTKAIYDHLAWAYTYGVAAVDQNTTRTGRESARVAARVFLGKAIHTLQDFYAHSNWAETRPSTDLFFPLTDAIATHGVLSSTTYSTLAAPKAPKDGVGPDAGGGLVEGDGCDSRTQIPYIGRALNSWSDNDGNYVVRAGGAITTGAWWRTGDHAFNSLAGAAAAQDTPGSTRCDHGVSDALTGGVDSLPNFIKMSGIAKDMPNWPLRPGPSGTFTGALLPNTDDYASDVACLFDVVPKLCTIVPEFANRTPKDRAAADATGVHLEASYHAARHTKLLLEKFVERIRLSATSVEQADAIVEAIFGAKPVTVSRIWVVDRSGTMADSLPAIRGEIERAVQADELLAPLSNTPRKYTLVDFNGDVDVNNQLQLGLASGSGQFIVQRAASLVAKGGGGCRTPVWTAVEAALKDAPRGSVVTIFTDASSSDASAKEADVQKLAQDRGVKIIKVISGSCSPIDPSYSNVANATNGVMLLVEHSAEGVAAAGAVADAALDSVRTVHTESGLLSAAKAITFPVESGVAKLTISTNGALSSVTITQPSGSTLISGNGVNVSQVLNGTVYVIASPQQGDWVVTLNGVGAYSVSSSVSAAIDFDLVEQKSILKVGRPGHEYRPQLAPTGQVGRVWMKTHIVGAEAPVTLDLLRLDGSVIASAPLTKMTTSYFEGEVTLPAEAHRFRVRGLAADGTAFARIHGQGNVAPPVALPGKVLATLGTAGTWRAGTANAFAINLKNLGGDDTVSFASGTLPTSASVSCNPSSIAVPGSEQVNVLCSINLPEAPDRADFSVVVTLTTAVPATSQTVTIPLTPLKLPLSCALDIDGDNRVDPAVDGVLLTRYLLGFRGSALTAGLAIPGPRKTDALLAAFFGNAAQFDLVGRASPAPTATVDGLLMTRLMLGYDDAALLTGINVPAGAQFTTAAAIKDNVVAKCAGGF